MTTTTADSYDHFWSEGGQWEGLFKHLKATNFFNEKLQITDQNPSSNKGVPSTALSVAHNTLNGLASPFVDTANEVSSKAFHVLKTIWVSTPIVWHPIETIKENGFFKWTWKVLWTAAVGWIWWLTAVVAWIASAPAKAYERIINDNVQELTGLLHLTSDKVRSANKFGLKTVIPWIMDSIANGTKVLSKTWWYLSWAYLLNWVSRKLNQWVDLAQEFTTLSNLDVEKHRMVKNEDPTVLAV